MGEVERVQSVASIGDGKGTGEEYEKKNPSACPVTSISGYKHTIRKQ